MRKLWWVGILVTCFLSSCVSVQRVEDLEAKIAKLEKSKPSAMILAEQAGARKFWWRNALTGSAGNDLESFTLATLTDGDVAAVATKSGTTGTLYFYVFDSDDTTATSSPSTIRLTGGTGVWFLAGVQTTILTGNATDGTHYMDMSNTATLDAGSRADGRCWYAKDNNRIECYDGTNVQYWTATGNE